MKNLIIKYSKSAFIKILIIMFSALFLLSCNSSLEKEAIKNSKQNNASSRINASQSNNDKIRNELND